MSRGTSDITIWRWVREKVREERRWARNALGLDGILVLVVGGLLALALLIWVLVAGWPLMYITLGLLIAGLVMKTRRRKLLRAALVAFVVMCVVATVQGVNERGAKPASQASPPAAAPASAAAPLAAPSVAPAPAASAPSQSVSQQVVVSKVIDGDTFRLADGTEVRPLGIDSCEMSTAGGKEAKQFAETAFANPYNLPVTLTKEPGVERDKFGRLLRYVQLNGSDYGEYIVPFDHTAVYAGKNDAAPSYVAKLRTLDNGGRNCAGPPLPPNVNVDLPEHHDDGGESWFCRRRRWC